MLDGKKKKKDCPDSPEDLEWIKEMNFLTGSTTMWSTMTPTLFIELKEAHQPVKEKTLRN